MNNVIMDSQILTALMKCPRYTDYYFNKNRRLLGGKDNPLECGSLVHTILEHFYKSIIAGNDRVSSIEHGFSAGKEYLVAYKESNIYIKDKDHKGLVNTPELSSQSKPRKTGYKHVFHTMEQYFDYWRAENWTPIAAEIVRKKVIYEDSDIRVMWKAKFDLIEDSPVSLISTDHKTMSMSTDLLSLDNQFIGQCVLLNQNRMQINKIGFQTSLPDNEKFTRTLVTYSDDRIAEWIYETIPYYARMLVAYGETGYWPQNFSNCKGKFSQCYFVKVCERDRSIREEVLLREYEEVKPWDINNEVD